MYIYTYIYMSLEHKTKCTLPTLPQFHDLSLYVYIALEYTARYLSRTLPHQFDDLYASMYLYICQYISIYICVHSYRYVYV